ncbi:MAG: hypothetical protein ACRBN8_39275 [Nannocystales bacterium]
MSGSVLSGRERWALAAAFMLMAGCANRRPPGTQPDAMSVQEHNKAASLEQARASAHGGRYHPGADPLAGCTGDAEVSGLCWSSRSGTNGRHRTERRQHAHAAQLHRQAADTLEAQAATACRSVAASDRERSPVLHPRDLVSVDIHDGGVEGAVVTIVYRPVVGMTPESLGRVVDCHLAHSAVLGHPIDDLPDCPLVPRGVWAEVGEDEQGRVSLAIGADRPSSAIEVRSRAERLRVALP